ncbi:hypothetical protein GCK72_015666 [Caenorhabditis remanei]|uniref:SGNH domain-containing protein n=1 Tax=Caenorhabditis remanei TaxID=31234 RepID=A0A6A5GXG0_CAERE|nr:hypothetical protein GCK72_015666 [Caenorhabditis remanei]KAF1759205.1 hypothetical protein GCK72_015666 [Caenorhabditis remanei]
METDRIGTDLELPGNQTTCDLDIVGHYSVPVALDRYDRVDSRLFQMKSGFSAVEKSQKSQKLKLFHSERGRRRHAELVKKECGSKCELIDYVDAFWNKTMNAFQYFDNQGFSYFTNGGHLSPHGLEHVRPIYEKICLSI